MLSFGEKLMLLETGLKDLTVLAHTRLYSESLDKMQIFLTMHERLHVKLRQHMELIVCIANKTHIIHRN